MTTEPGERPNPDVVFVGRANIDLAVHVPFRPLPGQTAFGSPLTATPGGKSLNQAIAAARLGARTAIVANAGADQWGEQLLAALNQAGIDTRFFRLIPHAATGTAIIEITPDGDNSIILAVSPATEVTGASVTTALTRIDTEVVVVQLDMDPEPITACLEAADPNLVIGNLIPDPRLDRRWLHKLDMLVVNQHEAATILDTTCLTPIDAAEQLRRLGPRAAVVTAGPQGAAYSTPECSASIPAPPVTAVDTTGAGDAFLGCLAANLAHHTPLPEAVTRAIQIGSQAVQHPGAQLPPGISWAQAERRSSTTRTACNLPCQGS